MARTDLAIVKRNAIFVKEKKDGRYVYVRRPFDIVEYNWGDTSANRTYIQPHFNSTFTRSVRSPVYDDIRIYDAPPDFDLCGRGSGL